MRLATILLSALLLWTPLLAAPPEATPEKIRAALPELEKLAEKTLQSTGTPGMSIVVVHKDAVVFLKGFGVREAGKNQPIDADTVFQIASMSKPMATTVLAALVAEGTIGWDDRVIRHDPEFRMFDPWVTRELTLRDLLCHRSGLPEYAGDLLEDMGYERSEILQRLRYLKPASSFRSQFAYTNFGFTEGCVAAARAAGKPWEELAAEKLYRPLGMKSTSSRFADYETAANRVLIHVKEGDKWVAKNVRRPDAQAPAGGVCSTARDLGQWIRLQLAGGKLDRKQLISAEALAETHHPQIVTALDAKTNHVSTYALGWNVGADEKGRVYWRHSGGFFLGVRTEVALLPGEELGIAVLSNAAPTGIPEGMTRTFFDLVLEGAPQHDWIPLANGRFEEIVQAALGAETDYSKRPPQKSPPLPVAAYRGSYANTYYGEIEIIEKDGVLQLQVGPRELTYPLTHWDRDVFVYQPIGESAGGPSGVTFVVGPDRRASQVVIENLNRHGEGVFGR